MLGDKAGVIRYEVALREVAGTKRYIRDHDAR